MNEQEFYDELWNEFRESDDNGTFTTWLVNKMGIINVYIERLRADLAQARRSQGIPRATHTALERDNQRLRERLEEAIRQNATPPAVGQPRPIVAPNPGRTDPYVPYTPNTTGGAPATWNIDTHTAIDWSRIRDAQDFNTRGRLDEVGQQERFERIRAELAEVQRRAQDRNRGES